MKRLTTSNMLLTSLLGLASIGAAYAQSSAVRNIRLTVDEGAGQVRILYDLNTIRSGDSVSVSINGSRSGRLLIRSVQGDIGKKVKAGADRSIKWDVVKDNINLDEDVTVTILITSTTATPIRPIDASTDKTVDNKPVVVRTKRSLTLPIIGLVAAAGLGGYGFSQYLANQKDEEAYDAIPYIESAADAATIEQIRSRVEARNSKIMLPIVGAGVILAADVAYMMLAKPKPRRTAFNLQMQSGALALGFRHTF